MKGLAYAKALNDAGVDVIIRDEADLIHGFYNLRRAIPLADAKLNELRADICRILA